MEYHFVFESDKQRAKIFETYREKYGFIRCPSPHSIETEKELSDKDLEDIKKLIENSTIEKRLEKLEAKLNAGG